MLGLHWQVLDGVKVDHIPVGTVLIATFDTWSIFIVMTHHFLSKNLVEGITDICCIKAGDQFLRRCLHFRGHCQ